MATILFYLTKAKPFVCFDPIKKAYVLKKKAEPGDHPLNGTVCARCDVFRVEKIIKNRLDTEGECEYFTLDLSERELLELSCLSKKEMSDYGPKFAIYLKNPRPIEPMAITHLAKDGNESSKLLFAHAILTRAPQNMCKAWCFNNGIGGSVIVISIRARFFCDVMNGKKDIEVRRSVLKELKEVAE